MNFYWTSGGKDMDQGYSWVLYDSSLECGTERHGGKWEAVYDTLNLTSMWGRKIKIEN